MKDIESVEIACDIAVLIQSAATLESDIADLLLIAQDLPGVSHDNLSERFPTRFFSKKDALFNLMCCIGLEDDTNFDCLRPEQLEKTFDIRNRLSHDKVVSLNKTSGRYSIKLLRFHAPQTKPPGQTVRREEYVLFSEEMKERKTTAIEQVDALWGLRKEVWSRLEGWPRHFSQHVPNALVPTAID